MHQVCHTGGRLRDPPRLYRFLPISDIKSVKYSSAGSSQTVTLKTLDTVAVIKTSLTAPADETVFFMINGWLSSRPILSLHNGKRLKIGLLVEILGSKRRLSGVSCT